MDAGSASLRSHNQVVGRRQCYKSVVNIGFELRLTAKLVADDGLDCGDFVFKTMRKF